MASQEIPEFLPGDIILCPGQRIMPHILTRWATQAHGEGPTFAVHTAPQPPLDHRDAGGRQTAEHQGVFPDAQGV